MRALCAGADAVICNFEGCLPPPDVWPMKRKTVHAAHPDAPRMLADLGVTHVGMANNHAWDFGHPGLLNTRRAIEKVGLAVAGAGASLSIARAPAIHNGVALLSVDAGPTPDWACASTGPGVNALSVTCTLGLPATALANLDDIAEQTGSARRHARRQAIGYDKTTSGRVFYGMPVENAASPTEIWRCDAADVARIGDDIQSARSQADLVIVALHYHHWSVDWQVSPEWLSQLGSDLLAGGADAVVCTGPPVSIPVQHHGAKVVAPGLGNLVFHTARAEKYDALGIPVRQGSALTLDGGTWRDHQIAALV